MNTVTTPPRQPAKRPRHTVPLAPAESKESKRLAAVILEVLAGVRTPGQAAEVLHVSLPRYYQLEVRALRGLVESCEPKPKGRQAQTGSAEAALRRENEHLRREVTRQQSLVRLTQRNIGLTPPAPKAVTGKKRKRRPCVRALQLAQRLQREAAEPPAAAEEDAVAAAAVDS
jgi:hypothetical protein